MKILVTGVAGFLGSHLCKSLLRDGNQIIGVDDLSTGQYENIKECLTNPNFKFINEDIRNPLDFEVDAILNFACPASPIHYQSDPIKTIETNFLGMSNMLKLADKYQARILQASTSEIYGDPIISPQVETYWGNVNPAGIRSCYDEGKRAAETLCFDYRRHRNLDVRVIRIFNTYGPNMAVSDGRVVSNFIVQSLQGQDLTIYGDGSQTRSFCYVDDLIRGICLALSIDQYPETAINLGNPENYTMLELAEKVKQVTNSSSKIVFKPLPGDDPQQRKPDIELAKRYLGWEPTVGLVDGLTRTSSYFKQVI